MNQYTAYSIKKITVRCKKRFTEMKPTGYGQDIEEITKEILSINEETVWRKETSNFGCNWDIS